MSRSKDDKWKELQENGKEENPLKGLILRIEKKLLQTIKVIHNPDQYNVNISSRERLERLEHRVKDLEEMLTNKILKKHLLHQL